MRMRRRLVIPAVVFALSLAVAPSVGIATERGTVTVHGPAAGSSDNDHTDHTIQVVAIVTELNLVNVSTKGPSLGDEIVFSQKLLQSGNEVGHAGAVCTTVSLERQEAQCIATYSFGDGQITAQTLIILGSKAPYAVSITGGSGKYEGAAGEVHVSPVSDTEGILTFDLED